MSVRVLSLDISSVSTGWAFVSVNGSLSIKTGVLSNKKKFSQPKKLKSFRCKLVSLINRLKPTHVVIEDVYSKINIKTYGLLSMYVGVAQEAVYDVLKVESYIISTNTVKAFFKLKSKQDVFEFVVEIFGWKGLEFKKDNDKTDATAQLLCYCQNVLDVKDFRTEKDYGYIYEV